MKNLFILLAIVFMAFSSCKPDKITDVVVEGVLLDISNFEPIEGGLVEIRTGPSGFASGGRSPRNKFLEYKTDETGVYHFEFSLEDGLSYQLIASSPHHYGNLGVDWSQRFTTKGLTPSNSVRLNVRRENYFNETIFLLPQATLRLRIVNVDKVYDRFHLNTPPVSPLASGIQLYGNDIDEMHEFTVFGDVEIKLNTFRYRPGDGPGEGDHVRIPLVCKPHDVTEFTIEY